MRNSIRSVLGSAALGASLIACASTSLSAQNTRYVFSIGDHPDVVGVRVNFRDNNLGRVDGLNLTLWSPYEPYTGRVRGVAFGLPATGADEIVGLATGVFGAGAGRNITGVGIAPVGIGAGNRIKGIGIGGVGLGAGGDVEGIMMGGIGIGAGGNLRGFMAGGIGPAAGGDARGILLGGVGAGVGGDLRGLAFGGVGVGVGGNARGILAGGVGAGIGGDFRGLGLGGVGVGVGGDMTGILVGGVGAGVGGRAHGLIVGGLGAGAYELDGIAIGGIGVGGHRVHGFTATAGILRIERDGRFEGFSVNATGSMIKGHQRGVVIGLVNYARTVSGLQIGLINIIDEARSHRILPFFNWQD